MSEQTRRDAHGCLLQDLDISGRDPETTEQENIEIQAGEAGNCESDKSYHQEAHSALDDEAQELHVTSESPLSLSRHLCEIVSQTAWCSSETNDTQRGSTMQQPFANDGIESATNYDLPPSIPASLFIPSNYELDMSSEGSDALVASSATHNDHRTIESGGSATLTLKPRLSRAWQEHLASYTQEYKSADSLPLFPSDTLHAQRPSIWERESRNSNISSQDVSTLADSRWINNEADDCSSVLQVSLSDGCSIGSNFLSLSPSCSTSPPSIFRSSDHDHHSRNEGKYSRRSTCLLEHEVYNATEKMHDVVPEALTDEISLSTSPSKVAKPIARKGSHDIVSGFSPPQVPQAEYISPSRTSAFRTHKKSQSAPETIKLLLTKNNRKSLQDNQERDNIKEERCFESRHSWGGDSDTEIILSNLTLRSVGIKKRSRSFPSASFQNIVEPRSNLSSHFDNSGLHCMCCSIFTRRPLLYATNNHCTIEENKKYPYFIPNGIFSSNELVQKRRRLSQHERHFTALKFVEYIT